VEGSCTRSSKRLKRRKIWDAVRFDSVTGSLGTTFDVLGQRLIANAGCVKFRSCALQAKVVEIVMISPAGEASVPSCCM